MIVFEALLFSFGKVIATIGLARVGWLTLRDLILEGLRMAIKSRKGR